MLNKKVNSHLFFFRRRQHEKRSRCICLYWIFLSSLIFTIIIVSFSLIIYLVQFTNVIPSLNKSTSMSNLVLRHSRQVLNFLLIKSSGNNGLQLFRNIRPPFTIHLAIPKLNIAYLIQIVIEKKMIKWMIIVFNF